ncbi:hypothetical protein [Silvimonas sp.]|uniref:hypothetical protein n=1 Tax=Silvimonas sp. TaxID=2650811 RepID=UPI002845F140|nr:hypothetical protein [Silvimonas sp.]MDR3430074.1 hypothetical protein [Silvimonas sp.]
MDHFSPYANEADTLQIGELTLENRLDRIAVFGSLDITKDQAGLAAALALQTALNAVVHTLQTDALPEHISVAPISEGANPF